SPAHFDPTSLRSESTPLRGPIKGTRQIDVTIPANARSQWRISPICQRLLVLGATLKKERLVWCFRAPLSVPALGNSSGTRGDHAVFDKRLLRGTPPLAYKIARICLVP